MVGEHSLSIEAVFARSGGVQGRENVGMSNRNSDENSEPRKSKVSSATEFDGGLDDPKAMAKAAAERETG